MRDKVAHFFLSRQDSLVDPNDFSIALSSGGKRTVRTSLLDFLVAVRSDRKPDREVLFLFRFLASKFHMPRSFVTNKHLRATQA